MDESLSSELLAKYLASEASAQERAAVEQWAAASPANKAEFNRMLAAWAAKNQPRAWNVDHAWARVGGEIGKGASVTPITAKRPWHANVVLRIAAAAVLMAGVTYGWLEYGPPSKTPSLVASTKVGESRSVELADGTRVTLGPLSELRVAHKYNRSVRRVDLTGEAWFEVKHDSSRTFSVHAFGTITEDLGTSFSVRAVAGTDSVVRVVVAEGSVWVGLVGATAAQGATLTAKDLITVDVRALKANVSHNVVVEPLLAWRTGHVEFVDAPFAAVAADLARWYGVTTRVDKGTLKYDRVTYSMPTNNLQEALDVLGKSLSVKIERKGDTLFVR